MNVMTKSQQHTVFDQLEITIRDRLASGDLTSYVHRLVASGADRVLQKIGEEATEFVIAGKNNDKTEICEEGADLIFHLLVFLNSQGMALSDITDVLAQRAAQTDSENES